MHETIERVSEYYKRVNHWQNRRSIRVLPDQVRLQVTVPSCSHCVTCQRRVREFQEILAQKPDVICQWRTLNDGAYWVFFNRKEDQDPIQLLRDILEVSIT